MPIPKSPDDYMEILTADAKAHPDFRLGQNVMVYAHSKDRRCLGSGKIHTLYWSEATDQYVYAVTFGDGRKSDWLSRSQIETLSPETLRAQFRIIPHAV